jgi:hypothetical protein
MFLIFSLVIKPMIVRVRSSTAAIAIYGLYIGGGVEDMAKSLTRQTFGKPSHRVLELNETSDQVARLSEAGYAFKTKMQELEHQFEVKASELREDYIAEVLEIHTPMAAYSTGAIALQHARR